MTQYDIQDNFVQRFGRKGSLYFSPGRINLIGEHTDYNCGFVFPGAIDKGITVSISPNGLGVCRVCALDISGEDNYAEFGFEESDRPAQHWACYIFGVCREMFKRGAFVKCFDAVFSGNIPLGAGLSSSAALESVFAYALNDICEAGISKLELTRIGQSAEHNYCGVKCGIMDQFASIMGLQDNLIRLDCRSMEYEYFPFKPSGYRLVLTDTCVKHTLGNEYNERRASCENAVSEIGKFFPHVGSLRDANHAMLNAVRENISNDDYMRAKYILDEKERVMAVCDALKRNDYETVGKKMYETHEGLSREFTVSCPEADWLVRTARLCSVTGSRIMGGGFGGCTLNLVREELYDSFIKTAVNGYISKFGITPKVYDVCIGDGSRKLQNQDAK